MAANLDARITGSQAARLIGVSRQLINDWWKRGRLAKGDDGRYRYGDILEADRKARRCDKPGIFTRKPRQYATV